MPTYYYLKFILILVPHLPPHHLSGLFRFITKTIMCIFLLIYPVYIPYQSINLILWTYEIFKVAQKLRRSAIWIFLQPRCFLCFMSECQPALFATILSLCFCARFGDPIPNPHKQQIKLYFCKCL
jgi:hypothetical protein